MPEWQHVVSMTMLIASCLDCSFLNMNYPADDRGYLVRVSEQVVLDANLLLWKGPTIEVNEIRHSADQSMSQDYLKWKNQHNCRATVNSIVVPLCGRVKAGLR